MQERRRRAREYLQRNPPPQPAKEQLEKLTDEQLRRAGRNLGWFGGGGSSTDLYSSGFLADSSQSYDKWAQAYRMLGAMIDCDHVKQEGSHDNKNNNNQQSQTCSRWMLWAAVRFLFSLRGRVLPEETTMHESHSLFSVLILALDTFADVSRLLFAFWCKSVR